MLSRRVARDGPRILSLLLKRRRLALASVLPSTRLVTNVHHVRLQHQAAKLQCAVILLQFEPTETLQFEHTESGLPRAKQEQDHQAASTKQEHKHTYALKLSALGVPVHMTCV